MYLVKKARYTNASLPDEDDIPGLLIPVILLLLLLLLLPKPLLAPLCKFTTCCANRLSSYGLCGSMTLKIRSNRDKIEP